jgi:hypothetical protein
LHRLRQPGARLTFLGFTLRYDHNRYGRGRTFLNVFPSAKAQALPYSTPETRTPALAGFPPRLREPPEIAAPLPLSGTGERTSIQRKMHSAQVGPSQNSLDSG